MPDAHATPHILCRRDLLRGAALTGAAAFLPRPVSAEAPREDTGTKSPIRLGIASYTFRKFDTPNLKDVHLPMKPLEEVPAKAAEYRAAGFILTAAGNITFAKDDDDDIRPKFEYAKAAGIPILVCAPTRENLPRLEKFVKEYNIKLAIHNHGPEDKQFPSPLDVLKAVGTMDPRIGCCVDIGHTMRSGTDVVAALKAAGPRLFDVHTKDLADANSKESQVAVGAGIMPIRAIFEALIEMKYSGCVDLEYEILPDNPMPGVIESMAYMRGVLAGMGYKS
jgi:hypothetical protein